MANAVLFKTVIYAQINFEITKNKAFLVSIVKLYKMVKLIDV